MTERSLPLAAGAVCFASLHHSLQLRHLRMQIGERIVRTQTGLHLFGLPYHVSVAEKSQERPPTGGGTQPK